MSKNTWLMIFTLAALMTACAQPNPAGTPASAAQTPTRPLAAGPTATGLAACTARTVKPTPNPTQEALLPPPGEDDWVVGPEGAAVTLIEYSDFQ
jgi:hypothetical protein